jgi:acetoin utilization deacetylase AcuC-like enzyme
MLHDRVAAELPGVELEEAPDVDDATLMLAHDPAYVARVVAGRLDAAEQRGIGFPWSTQMVERSRRSTGATIAACRRALVDGVAVNLAGGTHHASADRGEGFCVFNDAAIAARRLQADAHAAARDLRVAIVDLDVHQGNGSARIFANDPSVFTLSLHGAGNYPFDKETSDLDVALPDGCGDNAYLVALDDALDTMFARFRPGLVIYIAGADPHEGDRLGRLSLSTDGLERRDSRVLAAALGRRLPVAVAMAGGYGRDLDQTVDIHVQTVRLCAAASRRYAAAPASGGR